MKRQIQRGAVATAVMGLWLALPEVRQSTAKDLSNLRFVCEVARSLYHLQVQACPEHPKSNLRDEPIEWLIARSQ